MDVTVDTVEELYTKLDEFAEHWLENGFNCEYYGEVEGNQLVSWVRCFLKRDSASVVPLDVTVVTPNVKIANPCASMGDKARFDYTDKVCHCKAYYEKKNGKCEEMACSENRYFDRKYDNGCYECSDNQRSKAGENVCTSFKCPNNYQEGREHMCLWKTTDTELIDDYGPNGLKLELKSVQDGINRIRQDDEYFKSCNCSAEEGTPHMLYGSTDYISCNCKDEKGRLKTLRFSFTDLSDWNGK